MSTSSHWYDICRDRRENIKNQAPLLISEMISEYFSDLNNLNADERSNFWIKLKESINQVSSPDETCQKVKLSLIKICIKLSQITEGHP